MKKDRNITCYSLNISDKYESITEASQRLNNLYRFIKRTIESDERFKGLSFIIGISNTRSHDAKVIFVHTGKRGRPKKVIDGTKKRWHFHTYIISPNGEMMSTLCDVIKNKLVGKYNISKNVNDNLINALNYIDRQCEYKYHYGNYFTSIKNKNKIKEDKN